MCTILHPSKFWDPTGSRLPDDGSSSSKKLHYPVLVLGYPGDLVSRLSNWPYGAYYGLLFGLIWDTKWAY